MKTGPQPGFQPCTRGVDGSRNCLSDGTSKELQGDLLGAWNSYQTGLAKFPASFELLEAAGRAVGLLRYDEALKLSVPKPRPAQPGTRRFTTIAALRLRRWARCVRRKATLRPHTATRLFEPPARWSFGRSCWPSNTIQQARSNFHDSCPSATGDLRCLEETVALKRAAGDRSHARQLAGKRWPTNPTADSCATKSPSWIQQQLLASPRPRSIGILPQTPAEF